MTEIFICPLCEAVIEVEGDDSVYCPGCHIWGWSGGDPISSKSPDRNISDSISTDGTLVLTAHAEAAYHPRQGAMSVSRDHAVLDQDLPPYVVSLRRRKGDALCKPARKFWGLSPGGSSKVDCPICIKRARIYGVKLP